MKGHASVPDPLRRRDVVAGLLSAGALSLTGCAGQPRRAPGASRVVIVGGGFAGASCARALRNADPSLSVALVEPSDVYTACPFSNLVIAGMRDMRQQRFRYAALSRLDIDVIRGRATDVDATARTVTLGSGDKLNYDRLVLAPGITLDFDALPGYDASAVEKMPHAWQAGVQTLLLRDQLQAMPDGGTVAIVAPANPYRCPPGPYERASVMAHYLKRHKPRSKILILDAKDRFSKQALFQQAWAREYPGMIEWSGLSDGAAVVRVDADDGTLFTDFDRISADVANVIPPQRAGRIAARAGVTDASGWCPVSAVDFASLQQPGIHVIGDAAIANAMPKSAFAANAQAKLCAVQIARALRGQPPLTTKLINTCYSYITDNSAISVADVYRPQGSRWVSIDGAGGTSPLDASAVQRRLEAGYAADWFDVLTDEVFG